jgi:hypothetical protein
MQILPESEYPEYIDEERNGGDQVEGRTLEAVAQPETSL